ncbi:DUF898 family protein [Erwinia sp. E602]|uniref:YjgN family protein n=1 Tax=unclassified Erwinia TaxID=2622719 RepID=UPI0006FFA7FA|nr:MULTISPECIES: YjgN family protein [unclassified Erwinia]KQN64416.1 hypothetical protein ASF13_00595 [Erwinia sp. Leaf53]PLV61593.1 membrane protein [Erwinia sp. B116]QUG74213.1 DUF898 family protein [Erwinia sp. E602]
MENQTSPNQQHPVLFHGRAGEYFSIWLVNALLTMITLGIYSAWATVRRRRYFYGNTEIAGDRFDYHARPMDILKGRIIVFVGLVLFFILSSLLPTLSLLFVLAFFALIPWIVIRSWRYNALMSSFRGVRFNYLCRIGRAYWVMYLCPLLMVIGLYLLVSMVALSAINLGSVSASLAIGVIALVLLLVGGAVVQGVVSALNHDLYINNMSFGTLPFKAQLSKKAFIKIVLVSFLIFLPFLVVTGLLIGSLMVGLVYAAAMGVTDPQMMGALMAEHLFSLFLAIVVLIVGGLFSSAYLVVAQRNYAFGQTKLGEALQLKSTLSTGAFLGLVLTNSLIVLFTLGLGTPIAEVRLARYMASSTALTGDISLVTVQAHHDSAGTAVAEEVAAAFDLNVGI